MIKLKNNNKLKILIFILLCPVLLSWGALGHEHINRAAVFSLPDSLMTFFYNHIDFITTESSIPDVRKYALNDKAEDPRHYFDIENFGSADSIPATLAEANAKYSKEFLRHNGILPWYIEEMMEKLTKAFKEKRKAEILFLASDLGHYIADANTPLHTTVNYDGQLTNQKGIHSFWETQLFKMYCNEYNTNAGQAVYIEDIHKEIWRMIYASNSLVNTLLQADTDLKLQLQLSQNDIKDSTESKLKLQGYTVAYAKQYHQKLNGMVEKQMQLSIRATASFWYTAWVNAGKPDLSDLDPKEQTNRNKKNLKKELSLYKHGKLIDIKVGK